jgi:hypothetical protein
MQRPPRMERLTIVIGRLPKQARNFSLLPAVRVTILLAACGSGTASGAAPASLASHGLTERVPASARVLMVTYAPGTEPPSAGPQPARPASVTITDLARVRQVSGLIDGLSLVSPSALYSCPAFTWGVVNLAFRNSVGGRNLAVGNFNVSGCPAMDLTTAGVQRNLNVSGTFTRRVLQIAGNTSPHRQLVSWQPTFCPAGNGVPRAGRRLAASRGRVWLGACGCMRSMAGAAGRAANVFISPNCCDNTDVRPCLFCGATKGL